MRNPVSKEFEQPGFQSGSIFTDTTISVGDKHLCTILDDQAELLGDNAFSQQGRH